MKKVIESLKKSPLFNLSLSSKELFHSNFLYWLAQNYPSEVGELFLKYTRDKSTDSKILKVYREKENIDLFFSYFNGQEILIENKVKSVPYQDQLKRYSQKNNKNRNYILLSLSEPMFFEKKSELKIGDALWHYLSYSELKDMLTSLTNKLNDTYHKSILNDYLNFIEGLIEIDELCQLKIKDKYNFHSIESNNIGKSLVDIRLHDFYLKKKYEILAYLVYRKLKDSYKFLLGFGEPLNWESEDYEIFTGYGMSRSLGLMDVKYKLSKNLVLGIQLQGEHYRMFVEDNNSQIAKKIKEQLDKKLWFNFGKSFPNVMVYPKKEKGFNKFGDTFFYKSVKLGKDKTIEDIINFILVDIEQINNNINEIRQIIAQNNI